MKKLFAVCLAVLLIGTAAACSDQEKLSTDEPTDSVQNAANQAQEDDTVDDELDKVLSSFTGVPTMDEKQQELCDKYLKPLIYSNFFFGDYFSETPQYEWEDSGIITIYQDLAGYEVWSELMNEYYQIAASEVEGLLMRYFPIDEETIQILAGSSYDPEADAYTMVERGGGPRDVVVTGNDKEGNILTINYDLYGPDPDEVDSMVKTSSGRLQVELLEDGQFYYVKNEITDA